MSPREVFYTDAQCWQYSLLFRDRSFYSPHEIYNSPTSAYLEARETARNMIALKKMMLDGADLAQKQMAHQTRFSESDNNISTTATVTTVTSVASEKTYKPESQSRKSHKGLLIGGSVAGVIAVLLLLIFL